jgi:broad specificity phosphatase PhoE
VRATSSRHCTSRGQRRQSATSVAHAATESPWPRLDATAQSLRWALVPPTARSAPARPPPEARPQGSSRHRRPAGPPRRHPHHRQDAPRPGPGLHLADKGHEQAGAAAERIAAWPSPDRRLRVTAGAHARDRGPHRPGARLRVRTAPGLVEVDVGDWTEKSLARLYKTKEWPTVQRWPGGFSFPGGESFAEMSVRSMDTVLDLVAEHPGETIVAVSHADPIKAIVAAAAGMPLDLMQRLVISPCSISALLFTAGGPCRAVHELHGLAERAGAVSAMSDENDFDAPDHCTVGVVGEVGQRLFLFYCRQGLSETTVKVEKQQVAVLAGYLGRIVKELGRPATCPTTWRSTAPRTSSGWWGPSASPTTRSSTVSSWSSKRWASRTRTKTRRPGQRPRAPRRPHPRAGGRLRHPRHPPGRVRAARPARCARSRWTRPGTTARAPTGTGHR